MRVLQGQLDDKIAKAVNFESVRLEYVFLTCWVLVLDAVCRLSVSRKTVHEQEAQIRVLQASNADATARYEISIPFFFNTIRPCYAACLMPKLKSNNYKRPFHKPSSTKKRRG
jgi:hypothetical protein